MKNHDQANYECWETLASVHRDTPMYQGYIDRIKSGEGALNKIERELLGDVTGLKLLHLQCHIGTDSLSLAQMGAEVTGVDFTPSAISEAQKLSADLGIPAKFIQSSVTDPELNLGDDFDIVFASYGALLWLSDLGAWADTIDRHLKVGGLVVVVDGHPMSRSLSQEIWEKRRELVVVEDYFESDTPIEWEDDKTYAGDDIDLPMQKTFEWSHSISETLMSLISRGMRITHFGEHQECMWQAFDGFEAVGDGSFRPPEAMRNKVPLLFSLAARKT